MAVVRDVGRRIPALARDAPREDPVAGFYAHLGGEDDLSLAVVHHAGEFLREDPERSDRVLLNAIIDAAGDRALIRQVLGPGAVTALSAITPIAHWAPSLSKLETRETGAGDPAAVARTELSTVLQETAKAADDTLAGDAVELFDSLRYTVEYIKEAIHAVSRSTLEHAIAEARTKLEADLDELRAVHEGAHQAPHAWRSSGTPSTQRSSRRCARSSRSSRRSGASSG